MELRLHRAASTCGKGFNEDGLFKRLVGRSHHTTAYFQLRSNFRWDVTQSRRYRLIRLWYGIPTPSEMVLK